LKTPSQTPPQTRIIKHTLRKYTTGPPHLKRELQISRKKNADNSSANKISRGSSPYRLNPAKHPTRITRAPPGGSKVELSFAQEIMVFSTENWNFEPEGRSGKLTHFELYSRPYKSDSNIQRQGSNCLKTPSQTPPQTRIIKQNSKHSAIGPPKLERELRKRRCQVGKGRRVPRRAYNYTLKAYTSKRHRVFRPTTPKFMQACSPARGVSMGICAPISGETDTRGRQDTAIIC